MPTSCSTSALSRLTATYTPFSDWASSVIF